MLEHKKRGIRNLTIVQMDALKMKFPDHDFDIAMVSFRLHELNYCLMVDMLKEMHRVLKPQGKLFIVDYEKKWKDQEPLIQYICLFLN